MKAHDYVHHYRGYWSDGPYQVIKVQFVSSSNPMSAASSSHALKVFETAQKDR
jgi:hypothetical protein